MAAGEAAAASWYTDGILWGMAGTTIKVPEELRDRLNARARDAGVTVAEVIARLIKQQERAERWEAIRLAMERTTPAQWADYREETRMWEAASDEDLATDDPRA